MKLDSLLESIRRHEGYRACVYKDQLGIDTIGYGFTIKDLRLDPPIAEVILREKVFRLIIEVYETFPWILDQPDEIKAVIVEMCYQLGVAGFSNFGNTIEHLKAGRYSQARDAMLKSKWAEQTPSRARELAEIVGRQS